MRKRRRWWFAGLTLALLAACVGVWKWSERPPYKFLEATTLIFTEIGDPFDRGNDCHRYFASTRPVDQLKDEMMALPVSNKASDSSVWGLARGLAFQFHDVSDYNEWGKGFRPPAPPGTTAIIEVIQAPTHLDKVQVWLYGLRWKGSRAKVLHDVDRVLNARAARAGP
jgi:hypothetical protein